MPQIAAGVPRTGRAARGVRRAFMANRGRASRSSTVHLHAEMPLPSPRLGRVKRAAIYAMTAAEGEPISTGQIVEWAYARQLLIERRNSYRDRRSYCRAIRRACEAVAVRAGRSTSIGRPIMWRLWTQHDFAAEMISMA